MTNWHIITCEYPPQVGGVSDYTRLLANQLRKAGDEVHIWAPACVTPEEPTVHRELGDFSRNLLQQAGGLLDRYPQPRTLLVQWVPHGYGKRGINLGFSRWIASRVRRGDVLYLMVHEPFLESRQRRWKHRLVSQMQQRMVRNLLDSATRVFVSIPGWEARLRNLAPSSLRFEWLPVPATVEADPDSQRVAAIRATRGNDPLIVGHLGTYSAEIRRLLKPALLRLLTTVPNAEALLLGSSSGRFADDLNSATPELGRRIHGTGLLPDAELANHIAACDLMLQPYPDGLSSRRTSLMNVIAQGTAVVSNIGHLSEPLWAESGAVALTSTSEATQLASLCTELLHDKDARSVLGRTARDLYRSRFDWPNVVARLRTNPDSARCAAASTSSNQSGEQPKLE